jgi:hypothetical protein
MIERYFLGLLTFGLPNNVTRFSEPSDRSGPKVLTKEEVERISAKLTYELGNKYKILVAIGKGALAVAETVGVYAAAAAGFPVLVVYVGAIVLAKYVPMWLKPKTSEEARLP